MRRAHRTDCNQARIIEVLRAIGCTVCDTSALGGGYPDLTVGRNGRNYLLEIKDGDQPPSRQSLTGPEAVFHNEWKGQIAIVNSVETALAAVGAQLQ